MSQTALDRLERVLLMVPWLLEHPGATFEDIAERFGGSVDDVAADLDTLGYCGLPGYGGGDLVEVTTFGDTVTIRMADFFRRPLQLSLREAVTLILAARSLLQVDTLPETRALRRALARLETLLGAGAAVDPERVRVAIDLHAEGEEHVRPIREAIAAGRAVSLVYRSASRAQTTTRLVEPWSVVNAAGAWYVRGHCRLAGGHRDFRLDRIVTLTPTDEAITTTPTGALDHPPGYRSGPDDDVATVDLHRSVWWFLERVPVEEVSEPWTMEGPWAADENDERAWRTAVLRVREGEWLPRTLLAFGDAARVRGPRHLADRLRYLATTLRDVYGRGPA